ncbi:MAG: lamin tail domain-containing protein, partial [Planctomycetales bacterium]|nr:lamin tail domain-containing protein [Planctomycetales bacterium]
GPPRWKGIHFKNSRQDDNAITYADIEYAQSPDGSVGVLESNAEINHVSFKGTHYRMVYATNASILVHNSDFPDMFAENEDPAELGLDNISEHIKATGRTPAGGRFIIQGNRFGLNKGHNDVIDVDSNRVTQGPIVQILDNVFTGSGDELLDLGGDVYVAGNLFRGVAKDDSTSDRGYANAISTGDAGANTTIVVTRNLFVDVDHAINLKASAATIFEYNTVVDIHPDFLDRFGNPSVASAINLYVDEPGATRGLGAYAGQNVFWNVPRVFGNADLPSGQTSALQFENNLLPAELALTSPGERAATVLDLGTGNVVEQARFVDAALVDYHAAPGSAAVAPDLPMSWGIDAENRIWITDEPAERTASNAASLTVGGPGMFAYRYRVNGGEWTDAIPIGSGFDRNGTVRTAKIEFLGLPEGSYYVDVQGRDFAGVWQTDVTRSRTWTVESGYSQLLINEVLADNQTTSRSNGGHPDMVELYNAGQTPINLRGLQLSDNRNQPNKFVFTDNVILPGGGYVVVQSANGLSPAANQFDFALDNDGEGVYLFSPAGVMIDSVEFGSQVPDKSVGRVGTSRKWALTEPTFGSANQAARLGDPAWLSINEWLAAAPGQPDFVELYNADTLPVAIGGFYISDAGDGTPQRQQIKPLSYVAPRGFLAFEANASNREATRLEFGLNHRHETLRLSDAHLQAIDTVVYVGQVPGISQGRLPDGGLLLSSFSQPTPGWVNGVAVPGDLDGDGLVDIIDVDLLCQRIRSADAPDDRTDLNRDRKLDRDDMRYLLEVMLGTTVGDSNLDGVFD